MNNSLTRRAASVLALLLLGATSLTGCVTTAVSGPQPELRVLRCGPVVEVEVHNTDSVAHRYTVTLEVEHDGMVETALASSESIRPGATARVATEMGEEGARCRVIGAQTFRG